MLALRNAKDFLVIFFISVAAFVSWCAANDKWTTHSFGYPTSYLNDPEHADFFYVASYVKAAEHWRGLPFCWKTVPELGAPFEGNWNDFPTVDELVSGLQATLAKGFGLFAGINLSFALAHVLAGVALYLSARLSECNRLWASVGAFAFGLSPFIFAHSPHHMQVAYVWPIPFFPLAWRWVARSMASVSLIELCWALGFSFLVGLHFIYYTNVFCQLLLLAAAIESYRMRSVVPLRRALAMIAVALFAIALMNIDTWSYRLLHGPNPGAFVREYKWLEIYGLKIKDLLIPPMDHRSATLSAFSIAHRQVAPLLDERASYLGLIGLLSLIWLVSVAVKAVIDRRNDDVPTEAWQILWILVVFTTGGLNAIAGVMGFTMFRGGCRYSIVILAITLLWAARRLTAMQAEADRTKPVGSTDWGWLSAAAFACAVIFWDQVPRSPTDEETATIARQVDADREFTEKMEATLPDGAMVFQLPVMEFPESPIPGVPPYDHFRPYLFSNHLRFSFGTHKGRERERWQPAVQAKFFEGAALDQQAGIIRVNQANAQVALDELKRLGFSAIYINRNGFPDRGKGIEEALLELGYTKPPIRNATGDLACIVLQKDAADTNSATP